MTYQDRINEIVVPNLVKMASTEDLQEKKPLDVLMCVIHDDGHIHTVFPDDMIVDRIISTIREQRARQLADKIAKSPIKDDNIAKKVSLTGKSTSTIK